MRRSVFALALLMLCGGSAFAQVDANLGTIISGAPVNFSGTTVGASNDIDNYSTGNPPVIWDQDYIYQFNIVGPGTLVLDSNDLDTDPDMDFFVLQSLTTTVNSNGLRQATAIAANTSNGLVFVDGSWFLPNAGTYYLAIDAWRGNPTAAATPAAGRAGAFSGSLSFTNLTPPTSLPAGLNATGSITGTLAAGQIAWYSFEYSGTGGFSINTNTSAFDTELGLYNSNGLLITNDDDAGDGSASLITAPTNLAAGTYYLAIGGFNTTFGASGFNVASTATAAAGAYRINGVVTVPEPTTPVLLMLGATVGGVILRRRKKA